MRIPKPLRILKSAFVRTFFFMKEAVPVFLIASVVVFMFEKTGGLAALGKALHPVAVGILGLPDESVTVFLKTIIRRESGVATLQHYSAKYTNLQLVVNLLIMLVLAPCINAVVVVIKERGRKTGLALIGLVSIYALLIGAIVNHSCRSLNIAFS